MRKLILMLLLCWMGTNAFALMDWNIDNDETITGGQYGTVNIYDTPPDQTVVDMLGGEIDYCNVFDTAIFNYENGKVENIYIYNSSVTNIYSANSPDVSLYNESQVHMYNGSSRIMVLLYDLAQLHIYGYNLEYVDTIGGPDAVTGKWENGQDFTVLLRTIYSYNPDQIFLYEIPEPMTFVLMLTGTFLIRKR